MSLREAAREALSIKCDVECFNALSKLRRECREKGLDPDRVNKIIRSVNHEISRDKQHTKPVPEPKPTAEEKVQEAPELQGSESELSRRVEFGDAGTGGRPKRKSSMSIIDMAEGRS